MWYDGVLLNRCDTGIKGSIHPTNISSMSRHCMLKQAELVSDLLAREYSEYNFAGKNLTAASF
jgi:hypothetical protein